MKKIVQGLVFASFLCAGFSLTTAQAQTDRGEAIYKQACKTCHNPSTAPLMKSPVVHDVAAWKLRIDAAKAAAKKEPAKYKDAMAFLVATIKQGKGAMPAGGMCVDQSTTDKKCTDADYIAAIKFMSTKAKE